MKTRIFIVGFIALLFSTFALAQPAPWYKWKSKLNGKIVCTQTSPGEGWEQDSGPYKDARCEKPATSGSTGSIPKPTANQVLTYAKLLADTPNADRAVAAEALQKWMDGKLTASDAEKYKNILKMGVQKTSTQTIKPMNTELCAACLAACCIWIGCDPTCQAACYATACK